jgi:gas vesicle protein
VGPFLLGVVLGALAGVLYAPARGDVTRRRIGRRVGDLKDLAEEKYGELTAGIAGEDEDEEDEDAAAAEEPTTREELERRLREARRRRRVERAARGRRGSLEEDDEPVA